MSGIFRDVYLLSREKNHIKDIVVKAENKKLDVSVKDYEVYGEDLCVRVVGNRPQNRGLGRRQPFHDRLVAAELEPDTKGEAVLQVELGSHSFLKVKVESVEKAEGATE